MNALQAILPCRKAIFWIEAKDAIPLLRQIRHLSSLYAPNPAPHVGDPLRLRQVRLATLQLLSQLLHFGNQMSDNRSGRKERDESRNVQWLVNSCARRWRSKEK